tara:strand:- start:179 stop:1243 length:1065 start_codon:yes stop_codon:yes gene_type:complete
LLPDGRLAVGFVASPFADHFGLADWVVLVSEDQGETFEETNDPTIPLTWPGTLPRERYDRFADILPNGTYLAAGTVGFEVWPKDRLPQAEALGLYACEHPNNLGEEYLIGTPKLFVQTSADQGQTWQRREWLVPGFNWMTAFPRWTQLQAGHILLPVYARNQDSGRGQNFVWRSDAQGDNWRLIPISSSISDVQGDETGFIEVEPGHVLALMRHDTPGEYTAGYLLESWSEDSGLTWSQPLRTDIKGYPPHLLRLQDGRLLCGVTYRWEPMGIRLLLSADNGKTWDVENTIIMRDDAGTPSTLWPDHQTRSGGSDVGYPMTVQFDDGSLFTCYWITLEDGVTHIAATKWRLDEI